MRLWSFLVVLLAFGIGASAQDSKPAPSKTNSPDSKASEPASAVQTQTPDLAPPRSDSINAAVLPAGESSSKDTQIDLSPPENDARAHPQSSEVLKDEGGDTGGSGVGEFHPWDPHRAAKDIEVGDFYFKRKNYAAAESRYREALYYKDNDAMASFKLGVCLEKMNQPDEARKEFERYLQILPHGPEADNAQKAIERLKKTAGNSKPGP